MAQQVTNPTSIHEDEGLIPGLAQSVKDLAWLWVVRQRPEAAALMIQPLASNLPCASCVALKSKSKKKKKKCRHKGQIQCQEAVEA